MAKHENEAIKEFGPEFLKLTRAISKDCSELKLFMMQFEGDKKKWKKCHEAMLEFEFQMGLLNSKVMRKLEKTKTMGI